MIRSTDEPPQGMTPDDKGVAVRKVAAAGRGVFATRRFARGEVICRNPVLLLDQEDWRRCEATILDDYVYAWPEEGRPRAVSLGVGSLFNASDSPNIDVEIDVAAKTLTFRAIRPVEPGQELVLDYGWGAGAADRIRGGKSRTLHVVG
ncbi:SET domain-containing protein-lysine N-methyltransferase [Inquilinus limosus]|nr:SET domain-containing protein-lysine N-methyltransferase [Inquilinus limosus]